MRASAAALQAAASKRLSATATPARAAWSRAPRLPPSSRANSPPIATTQGLAIVRPADPTLDLTLRADARPLAGGAEGRARGAPLGA